MDPLLASEGRKRIEEAVAAAERRSRGEIVFAASPRSDGYARFLWPPVVLATIAVAVAVHLLVPTLPPVWVMAAEAPLAAALWWLVNTPSVALWLVPDEVEATAVRREALRVFAEHALYETSARTGVLVYVSLFERRVEIIADRGVGEVIDHAAWERHVAALVQAIRDGRAIDGACAVIGHIAEEMAQRLGPSDGSGNELPDLV